MRREREREVREGGRRHRADRRIAVLHLEKLCSGAELRNLLGGGGEQINMYTTD